jgi:hypothetical protein
MHVRIYEARCYEVISKPKSTTCFVAGWRRPIEPCDAPIPDAQSPSAQLRLTGFCGEQDGVDEQQIERYKVGRVWSAVSLDHCFSAFTRCGNAPYLVADAPYWERMHNHPRIIWSTIFAMFGWKSKSELGIIGSAVKISNVSWLVK